MYTVAGVQHCGHCRFQRGLLARRMSDPWPATRTSDWLLHAVRRAPRPAGEHCPLQDGPRFRALSDCQTSEPSDQMPRVRI